MMDDLIERVEIERNEADYGADNGIEGGDVVTLSRADCVAIGDLLNKAYKSALLGKRDADLAETLVLLAVAFEGDGGVRP